MINKKKIKVFLQYLFFFVAFYFLSYSFFSGYDEIKEFPIEINFLYLLLSFFLYTLGTISMGVGWYTLNRIMGQDLGFLAIWKNWINSQLGRYIPGKVWMITSRAYLYKKNNVSFKSIGYLFIMENIYAQTAASVFCLVSLIMINDSNLNYYLIASLVLVIAGVISLRSRIVVRIVNWCLKLLKKDAISGLDLRNKKLIFLFMFYFVQWFFIVSSLYYLVLSFTFVSLEQFFYLSAAISISAVLGFLAFVTPAGLGVRESIMVVILSNIYPASIAVIISILLRVLMTVSDVFLVSATVFLKKDRI